MAAPFDTPPPALAFPRAALGRAAALLLAVLLAHAWALRWVGVELQSVGFAPQARPIYAHLITPKLPVAAAPAEKPAPARVKHAPRPRAVAAAQPQKNEMTQAAVVPAPPPEAVASSPQAAASAPVPTAPENAAPDLSALGPPAAASAPVTAETVQWPPSTRIGYTLGGYYRGALHGTASFEWLRQGNDYQLFLRMHSLITQEYRSRGRIAGGWLQPVRYEEQGLRGVTAVNFNRDVGTLSFSSVTTVLPLPEHVQDTASTIMQLSAMLANDPARFSQGAAVPVEVARPRGLDRWDFEVVGFEQLSTGQGTLGAWHVRRVPRKSPGDIGVDLWLSPQLQSLPVRIKLTQAQDVYLDLLLDKAEQG